MSPPAFSFCTIANATYLPKVAALSRSLKAQHPEARLVLALVEREPLSRALRLLLPDVDRVVLAGDVFGPGFDAWAAGRTAYEAACGVKPALLRHMLDDGDEAATVHLDPDMDVHGRLDPLAPLVAGDAVMITPHLATRGRRADVIPVDEANGLRFGVYNLGFIAVGRGEDAAAFLDWWDSRVRIRCSADPDGPFVDQGWIDLAPGMFGSVQVLRHPGVNLATWDAGNRIVERARDGALRVNGEPLLVCHYSGWDAGHHHGVLAGLRAANPVFGELSDAYGERLAAQEALFGSPSPWSYAP